MGYYHPALISNHNFNDYASALKHYESVKPIRGDKDERRPIGSNRRYKYMEIRRPNELTVAAVLYDTPCVEYSEDGFITLNVGRWDTITTARFIDAVLPTKFGTVYVEKRRVVLRLFNGEQYQIEKNVPLRLKATISEDGTWTAVSPVNCGLQYAYVLNRKRMNTLRKQFKPFLDYMRVTTQLSDLCTTDEVFELMPDLIEKVNANAGQSADSWRAERETMWALRSVMYTFMGSYVVDTNYLNGDNYLKYKRQTANSLLCAMSVAASNDARDWRLLTISLAGIGSDTGISTETNRGSVTFANGQRVMGSWRAQPHRMKDRFERMLKVVYADLLFDRREVEKGTLASTTNLHLVGVHHALKDYLTYRQNVQL